MRSSFFGKIWSRARTAAAALALGAAVLAVRSGRLDLWRRSLGTVRESDEARRPTQGHARHIDALPNVADAAGVSGLAIAQQTGARVARAARLLPIEAKCLPRAVAAQWLLRLRGIPSSLIIAIHVSDRTGEHAYHAWVETDGAFVIGHCERSDYRAVMTIDQGHLAGRPLVAA